ncbi:RNA 2'-phosphotransferase [Tenacibaculum sp. 190524A02b]|uniref:RNA 2'-phosphotransferase n=1 Tax=Tenacibaculum vairaonense TaxID=3137860 RepID=UPI0031FAEDD4
MNEKDKKNLSKFLSLILRHQPETIQLTLDTNGWANVEELIHKAKQKRKIFSFDDLKEIVATNDKQRFTFNDNQTKIRANQGHSIQSINLNLTPITPPPFLYHGTVAKFMDSIRENGLQKMSRQHVHLSTNIETATKVGSRRGKPIILTVKSGAMFQEGYDFYKSENNVWLTPHVPVKFIEFKI